jgi:hypothetical protein
MRKAQPFKAIKRLMSSTKARALSKVKVREPVHQETAATGLLRPVLQRTDEFVAALRQAAFERSGQLNKKM